MGNVKMTHAKAVDEGQITSAKRSQSWNLERVTQSCCCLLSQTRTEQPLIILATFSHLYLETHKLLSLGMVA